MDYTSTPFISYSDIDTGEIELYEDAWGFNSEFCDVKAALNIIKTDVEDKLVNRLIEKIRDTQ